MQQQSITYQWKLEKYGRWRNIAPGSTDSPWKGTTPGKISKVSDALLSIYDTSSGKKLQLILTNTRHLLVMADDEIQENYALWNTDGMQVLSKADSLLLSVNHQGLMRQFRVQFSPVLNHSAVDQCNSCLNQLSKFLTVRRMEETVTQAPADIPELQGRLTIGQLTSQMCNGALPLAYRNVGSWEVEQVAALLPLCLSDSSFIGFVAEVEQQLKQLATGTNGS